MRLTLRTMLAYLDNVLESDDAVEIGKKVEESQFATDLSHRIRSCIRRLRLSSPPLDDQGVDLDANTVAEYLDSTLPDEQVPDFEKVCLDSDLQLAEVASCHQILTLVLGEPARIEPATRERMCRVGQAELDDNRRPVAAAVQKSNDVGTTAEAALPTDEAEKSVAVLQRHSEVPDYLHKDLAGNKWPVVATCLLAALLTLGVFRLLGPLDRSHPFFQAIGQSNIHGPLADQELLSVEASIEPDQPDTDNLPRSEQTATRVSAQNNHVDEIGNVALDDSGFHEITAPQSGNPLTADILSDDSGNLSEDTALDRQTVAPATAFVPAVDNDNADISNLAVETLPAESPIEQKVVEPANSLVDEVPVEKPPSTEPIEIGQFRSDNEVLIRFDPKTAIWHRLLPDTVLLTQDVLFSLPTYRSQIVLSTNVQATVYGGSRIIMNGTVEDPGIEVVFGQLLLEPVGDEGGSISLQLPGRNIQAVFLDAESELAVEVQRVRLPGADLSQPIPHDVRLIPISEGVEIVSDLTSVQTISVGECWRYRDDLEPEIHPVDKHPAWVAGDDLRDIDRLASKILESVLKDERPVGLMLKEKTDATQERRIEVRTLAIRSLTYLGDFEPSIQALADPDQRNWWQVHFSVLQESLARRPETADQVLASLQKHRGQDAELLLRLLLGYSPDELQAGGAAELVGYLDHDKLDFRVLARENLRMITETRPIYNPADTPAKRKRSIRRWEDKLEQGQIVYKNPPADVPAKKRSTTDDQL